ncbi:glutamate--cysteine ligase [Holosporaceae bacterium 'Namur']|nr:glutamate--cysteine ligase [Holosporaceae bacterium 'Namur']
MQRTEDNKYLKISEHLNKVVADKSAQMKEWIFSNYKENKRPLYGSVDVRNSGFKVAPVDTNLFPAGFNNLDVHGLQNAKAEFTEMFKNNKPGKILIIPENFTRNQNYFENLLALKNIVASDNIAVEFGSPHITDIQEYNASSIITLNPIIRHHNTIYIKQDWKPDLIILNTDLTGGVPEIIENITQPIIPELNKGWHKRRKFTHFTAYNKIVEEFCREFSLDPWLISTYIAKTEDIDFRNKVGLEEAGSLVDNIIEQIKLKYEEYQITSPPYVFIKADNGTFGMGIMIASSGDDILNINKKKRHSMDVIKEGVLNREIIIQEGVPTIHNINSSPYENIAYAIRGNIVSFIRRINSSRDHLTNLNSSNARFTCNSDFIYNSEALVAELALLASVYE